jgi:1-deoxy-D-xylulose-5-phosphate reductoisomerase
VKRIVVLGSTGSIGVQALEVVANCSDLTVVGLSCGSQVGLLLEQAVAFGVEELAVADVAAAAHVSPELYPGFRVRGGAAAAAQLVRDVEADLVLNAVVGFAGLESTVATLEQGIPLVSGGRVVTGLAARQGISILPVDSEHSALFQLLAAEEAAAAPPDAAGTTPGRPTVRSLVLTASGGPFRGRTRAELRDVTPEQALDHPTWTMGAKISIDSATLMNKGLEIIEAHHLFGVPYGGIEVVVHPQSLVHALVRLTDGALLAHLGLPDMRVPISYALHYPKRHPVPVADLDLAKAALEFQPPDVESFGCLRLAWEAGMAGDAATCALNAANEVAVEAFLEERLAFLGVADVIALVLDRLSAGDPGSYEEIRALDAWARREAAAAVQMVGAQRT